VLLMTGLWVEVCGANQGHLKDMHTIKGDKIGNREVIRYKVFG